MAISSGAAEYVFWRCLVAGEYRGESGFFIGYASLFDDDPSVTWRWLPQLTAEATVELIALRDQQLERYPAQMAQWFSRGYWIFRRSGDDYTISDLRFGEASMASADVEAHPQPWIFHWRLPLSGNDLEQVEPAFDEGALGVVWNRMLGERFAWEQSPSSIIQGGPYNKSNDINKQFEMK